MSDGFLVHAVVEAEATTVAKADADANGEAEAEADAHGGIMGTHPGARTHRHGECLGLIESD
ncbi:hypothetical protein [Paraburkholderia caffeinilytica]|uniref:hypothetical protein n=1 Tax=Paraburkholderia caffeinilytica TaxID=1761016 RepID=UPI0038B989CB